MASMLLREMKGSKFTCSSPASVTVCTSIDRRSIVCPGSGRSIDHHISHLNDTWRASSLGHLSRPPTKPKPYNQKSRKSTGTQLDLISSPSLQKSRKSTGTQLDLISSPSLSSRHRRSVEKQRELISPGNSSRFLLNDDDGAFFDVFPDKKPVLALPPRERNEAAAILRPSSSNVVEDQVVVLRVSLHCKGCEGKVRRHVSKMEGVTSFSIDMTTKKVIVIGKVTPLGVLNSISKVKNAEFWSAPPRSSVSF